MDLRPSKLLDEVPVDWATPLTCGTWALVEADGTVWEHRPGEAEVHLFSPCWTSYPSEACAPVQNPLEFELYDWPQAWQQEGERGGACASGQIGGEP